ncbi:hypothetical protein FRC09_008933 [Ceratobasidium sp. 395]|nr:hypothetical protein FRC09_008933 [Ceratobasidium sp. 395]
MVHLNVLFLFAFTSFVAAQMVDILGLSDSCNQAMGQVFMSGPAANCLNTLGLLNVLTTPSGQSWVGPFDSYLAANANSNEAHGIQTCGQPACTNDTFSAAIASLRNGCQSDLAAKGWLPGIIASFFEKLVLYYLSVREAMCLRDTGNDQKLCITTTLNNTEAMVGQPLNIGTLIAEMPGVLRNHNLSIPANISCTPCTQGAYTIARPQLPSESSVQAWDNFWINQCGENFISGTLPTSIAQTANPNTTTETPLPSQNAAALATELPPLGLLFGSLALIGGSMLATLSRG